MKADPLHELTAEADFLVFILAGAGNADRDRSPVTLTSAIKLNY